MGRGPDRGLLAHLTVQHLATRRNKRCLLAYHQHRLERLGRLFWSSGGALAHVLASSSTTHTEGLAPTAAGTSAGGSDTRSKLSPHEVDFLRGYNDLILSYKQEFLDVLDLSSGGALGSELDRPPKELFVAVKCVRDCGKVWTERGVLDLRVGERFLVRRGDVERLIVQGYLVEV